MPTLQEDMAVDRSTVFVGVDELPSSQRGAGGHGSTGGIHGWLPATDSAKEQA